MTGKERLDSMAAAPAPAGRLGMDRRILHVASDENWGLIDEQILYFYIF